MIDIAIELTPEQALKRIWQLIYPDDKETPDPGTVYGQLAGFIAQKDRELQDMTARATEAEGLQEENARFRAEVEKKRRKNKSAPPIDK